MLTKMKDDPFPIFVLIAMATVFIAGILSCVYGIYCVDKNQSIRIEKERYLFTYNDKCIITNHSFMPKEYYETYIVNGSANGKIIVSKRNATLLGFENEDDLNVYIKVNNINVSMCEKLF